MEYPLTVPSYSWAHSSTTKVTIMLRSFVKTKHLFLILSMNYKISTPLNFCNMSASLKGTYLVLYLTRVNSLFLSLIGYLLCVSHCGYKDYLSIAFILKSSQSLDLKQHWQWQQKKWHAPNWFSSQWPDHTCELLHSVSCPHVSYTGQRSNCPHSEDSGTCISSLDLASELPIHKCNH